MTQLLQIALTVAVAGWSIFILCLICDRDRPKWHEPSMWVALPGVLGFGAGFAGSVATILIYIWTAL